MFNLISKLSNVEQISGLIKPYSDRVNKLNSLAHVFDKIVQVEMDGQSVTPGGHQKYVALTYDEMIAFTQPFHEMSDETGDVVLFTDPTTGYTVVIEQEFSDSTPLAVYSCIVDSTDGSYSRRDDPFLFIEPQYNDLNEVTEYRAYWYNYDFRDCREDVSGEEVNVYKYAERIQDVLNSYNISLDAIKLTIKNTLMNAGDYVARVKTMYTGLKNGALELYQNITNALATHDVSSLVHVFKSQMNPEGLSVNNDGSVNFPSTQPTNDLNFGAVIGSALPTIVSTLGMVVTAVSKPLGIAIAGLGMIASSATKSIAAIANDSVKVIVDANSENVDIALKLKQQIYTTEASDLLRRNIIANTIKQSGYQPHKYELPGISGYIWPVNYDGTIQSASQAKMAHEAYLSCRGYLKHEDFLDLINTFFLISRVSYSYSAGTGLATVRITPNPNLHLDTFLNEYYSRLIPVDFNELLTLSDTEQNLIYQKCVYSDTVAATLLYALFTKIDELGTYLDVEVPINDHHPYPEAPFNRYNVLSIGVSFICDPFHDTYDDEPMISWDEDCEDWDNNPNLVTAFATYNETQTKLIVQAIDSVGITDDFDRMILDQVQWISTHAMTLYDPMSSYEPVDASFQFYPVEQRFNFRMQPPKWTRRSLVFNAILTGVTIAAIATVTAITAYKVTKWRKTKQLEMQAKTEAAWDQAKSNPTPENLKAYRSAALKQNTIGKIYGCSSVSNTNYWASTESPNSTPGDVASEISNLLPSAQDNTIQIIKLISGEDIS